MARSEIEEFISEDLGFRLVGNGDGISLFDSAVDFSGPVTSLYPLLLLAIGHCGHVYAASNTHEVALGNLSDLNGDSAILNLVRCELPGTSSLKFNSSDSVLYAIAQGKVFTATISPQGNNPSLSFTQIPLELSTIVLLDPSPTDSELLLLLSNERKLSILAGNQETATVEGIKAMAWTKDGSQVIGVSETSLAFYTTTGPAVSSHEVPEGGKLFSVSSIDNTHWLVVGLPDTEGGDLIYTLVLEENGTLTFHNVPVAPAFGDVERQPEVYSTSITNWVEGQSLLFATSALSTEISTIEVSPEKRLVSQLNDTDRAELPMDDDSGDDTLPVGFALDLFTTEITVKQPCNAVDEAKGVVPRLMCLNNLGNLIMWYVFDNSALKNNTLSLQRAIEAQNQRGLEATKADEGAKANSFGSTAFGSSSYNASTNSASAANENISASKPEPTQAFGTTGFSNASKPVAGSSGFGSSGFGSSGFGTSGFGSSGFGSSAAGSSAAGPSGFGTSGFGSSGFGTSGFGSSSFGNSTFGQATTSIKSDDKSKFGSSGFGSSGFGSKNESPFAQLTSEKPKENVFGSSSKSNAIPFGSSSFEPTSDSLNSKSLFSSAVEKPKENPFGSASLGSSSFGSAQSTQDKSKGPFASSNLASSKPTPDKPAASPFGSSGFGMTSSKPTLDQSPFASLTIDSSKTESEKPENNAFGTSTFSSSSTVANKQSAFGAIGFGQKATSIDDENRNKKETPLFISSTSDGPLGFSSHATAPRNQETSGSAIFGQSSFGQQMNKSPFGQSSFGKVAGSAAGSTLPSPFGSVAATESPFASLSSKKSPFGSLNDEGLKSIFGSSSTQSQKTLSSGLNASIDKLGSQEQMQKASDLTKRPQTTDSESATSSKIGSTTQNEVSSELGILSPEKSLFADTSLRGSPEEYTSEESSLDEISENSESPLLDEKPSPVLQQSSGSLFEMTSLKDSLKEDALTKANEPTSNTDTAFSDGNEKETSFRSAAIKKTNSQHFTGSLKNTEGSSSEYGSGASSTTHAKERKENTENDGVVKTDVKTDVTTDYEDSETLKRTESAVKIPSLLFDGLQKFSGFVTDPVLPQHEVSKKIGELVHFTEGLMKVLLMNSADMNKLINDCLFDKVSLEKEDIKSPLSWTLGQILHLNDLVSEDSELFEENVIKMRELYKSLSRLLDDLDEIYAEKVKFEKTLNEILLFKRSIESSELRERPLDLRGDIMRAKLRKNFSYVQRLQDEALHKLVSLKLNSCLDTGLISKLERIAFEINSKVKQYLVEIHNLEEKQSRSMNERLLLGREGDAPAPISEPVENSESCFTNFKSQKWGIVSRFASVQDRSI